jgi:hypothetical protein
MKERKKMKIISYVKVLNILLKSKDIKKIQKIKFVINFITDLLCKLIISPFILITLILQKLTDIFEIISNFLYENFCLKLITPQEQKLITKIVQNNKK